MAITPGRKLNIATYNLLEFTSITQRLIIFPNNTNELLEKEIDDFTSALIILLTISYNNILL